MIDYSGYKVACQGVQGAYSHQFALANLCGADILFMRRFDDVAGAVSRGDVDYGVLPLENSTAGSIDDTYRLLREYGLYIVGENAIEVRHCLLGASGAKIDDITHVTSHPQALAQCERYILDGGYTTANAMNTAIASQELSKSGDKSCGVIASKLCAEIYGLEVLDEGVQDSEVNYTRFVVVAKELNPNIEHNRVSVVCRTGNERNSLSKLLVCFSASRINMTKIASKNIANTQFEVYFYIDFEGKLLDKKVRKLFKRLDRKCRDCRVLGVYCEK